MFRIDRWDWSQAFSGIPFAFLNGAVVPAGVFDFIPWAEALSSVTATLEIGVRMTIGGLARDVAVTGSTLVSAGTRLTLPRPILLSGTQNLYVRSVPNSVLTLGWMFVRSRLGDAVPGWPGSS